MSSVLADCFRGLNEDKLNKQRGNTENTATEDSETNQETDTNELKENSQKSQEISSEMNAVFEYLTAQNIIPQ